MKIKGVALMTFRILAINPGSTSTKIGVYEDEELLFETTLRHSVEDLSGFDKIGQQDKFRKDIILEALKINNIDIESFDVVIGRGGLLKPIEGGTYLIDENMIEDLKIGIQGEHASNLGGLIAYEIAKAIGVESYIVDPVVVDELQDLARISGIKEIERVSIFHALNQKAVASRHAKSISKNYEDMNLIVVHLGGGITVGAHRKGRVIDVTNGLHGEGPFSPERSGSLPVGALVKLSYSGRYSFEEAINQLIGKGGLVSYLNTNDARLVSEMIDNGDEYAEKIYHAMAYQVSKEIGAISTVLRGEVDGILLTGGIAYDKRFTDWIVEMVGFISNVHIYPGEHELSALAAGGLRVLRGEEEAKRYN